MDALILEGTDDSPKVVLDPENNCFELSGKSLPEHVIGFYQPILDWIDFYAFSPNEETNFIFKLDYFNTASAKLILDILLKLEKMHTDGNKVLISWYSIEEDEDMHDSGEAYANMIKIPFEHISYE